MPVPGKRANMTLENAIAERLCKSNVGLFRKQIFDQIDRTLHHGNIEKVSQSLNSMKVAGHVEKSARQGLDGSRWSITPKGRTAYSVMHDDELPGEDLSPEQVSQKLSELSKGIGSEIKTHFDHDEAAAHHDNAAAGHQIKESIDALTVYGDRFKSVEFDINDELDRGLFGIVELIRGVAGQPTVTIQGKAECLTELEKLENAEFLADKTRAILTRVRLVIEELEDAA